MPPRKINRSKKSPSRKKIDPAEALTRTLKREEALKNRELMLEKMKCIFTKRTAERSAKKNAMRDQRIKIYETEVRNRSKTLQEKKMIQVRFSRMKMTDRM